MGIWDSIKGMANNAQTAIEGEISRFKNRDTLDALVGASVMIAAADGKISPDEKQKLLAFLQNSALSKAYSVDTILASFKAHADRFDFDVDIATREALRIIGKQRANVETARAIARLAVMIGKADGKRTTPPRWRRLSGSSANSGSARASSSDQQHVPTTGGDP